MTPETFTTIPNVMPAQVFLFGAGLKMSTSELSISAICVAWVLFVVTLIVALRDFGRLKRIVFTFALSAFAAWGCFKIMQLPFPQPDTMPTVNGR